MEKISVPRLIISGLTPQVGKSLITTGLLGELRQRGLSVACCVVGSNFKQAAQLRGLSERFVHTFDPKIQSAGQILESLYLASLGADIVLIEGEETLLHLISEEEGFIEGADTYISRITHTPILPILDGRNSADMNSRAMVELKKLVLDANLLPPIANQVGLEQSELLEAIKKINQSLLSHGQQPLLGTIPKIAKAEELPHFGPSQKRSSSPISRQYLLDLQHVLGRCLDIEELINMARRAPAILLEDYDLASLPRRCRIGVAMDAAFGLLYQDNLTFLKNFGAEIVPFSPLADTTLPRDIGGVYFPGGFVDEYGEDLVRNDSMIKSIRKFQDDGGCIYSEGSGTAFLSTYFYSKGKRIPGVGLIKTTVRPGDGRTMRFLGSFMEDNILGIQDMKVYGLITGDWQLDNPEPMLRCLRVATGDGKTILDGYSPSGQVFGTFSLLHWGTNSQIARNFADSSSVIKFQP
jgi:cobyrinic acid a,c-diamide synthase